MTQDAIARALHQPDALHELRAVLVERVNHGADRDDLLAELESVRAVLRSQGNEHEEDIVLEVMDFLTG